MSPENMYQSASITKLDETLRSLKLIDNAGLYGWWSMMSDGKPAYFMSPRSMYWLTELRDKALWEMEFM